MRTVTIPLDEYEKLKLESKELKHYKGDCIHCYIKKDGNFDLRSNFNDLVYELPKLEINIDLKKIPIGGVLLIEKTM